jgi:hypothetical protein
VKICSGGCVRGEELVMGTIRRLLDVFACVYVNACARAYDLHIQV